MTDTVQEIKSRLSIVDVVAPYVKLIRAGTNFKARCPFHTEKTPSFTVSPDRGTYHCFGCNVGGDMFTFLEEMEGVDFKGALKILAEKAGVPLVYSPGEKKDPADRLYACLEDATQFFEKNLAAQHPARAYLEKRGLTQETIESFRLGWAEDDWRALTTHLREKKYTDKEIEAVGMAKKTEKGFYDRFRSRIIFPLFDSAGRVVGFSGRIVVLKGEPPPDTAKYINSPETVLYHKSKLLYGYDRAKQNIRKLNFSILVEGQMDLLTVHQAGWKNAVAVSGTALTHDHINALMRMSENMVLALDADKAGIEAARRSASIALSMGMDVKVARLTPGSDPADFILKEGSEAWKKSIREAKHVVEFLLEAFMGQQKDNRAYAKVVRAHILPFIAMIQSPIDKDHFIHLVADRLAVSEEAVREETQKQRTTLGPADVTIYDNAKNAGSTNGAHALSPRVRQAIGVALWQNASKDPHFKKKELHAMLEDSGGKVMTDMLETIPTDARERLCFEAEGHFAHVKNAKEEIEGLFRLLKLDRLRSELRIARLQLSEAEQNMKADDAQELLKLSTILTNEIAKLREIG